MIATPDFKIFLVQFNVEIDNNIKYLVERYQDRLSQHSKMDEDTEDERSKIRCKAHRFSYLEISKVAEYLNHKEVENFRRISKAFNYGSCLAAINNIKVFSSSQTQNRYLVA
jgi:hypothetical protein